MRTATTRRWWWLVATGGWLLAASWASGREPAAGLAPGAKAPNFFVNTYNPEACGAKRIFLDKLVGPQATAKKKLLLLSFFNIDCKPCRKELPFLQRLYSRYRDAGLGVVVVNCDFKKDKIDQVVRYVKEAGFTFPVLKDRFQALQRRYAIGSFPTMYFVDGEGAIVSVRVGYNEKTMPFPLADVQRRLGVAVEPLAPAAPAGKAGQNKKHAGQAG